jgi:hypothetical protein
MINYFSKVKKSAELSPNSRWLSVKKKAAFADSLVLNRFQQELLAVSGILA